jgi:outer membrane receptor protein involved in Fe transport
VKIHYASLLAAPLPFALASASAAALQPDPDAIVVTATRSSRALADVPASVTVVSRNEIEGTSAKTLDDVLRRVPSVEVPIASSYQLHPTALNVSMRGLGGIRALVMLDGVPLNDPFFGYIQWSQVPIESVDRIEVVRGGGATLWGNYAMGGVINVITRAPDQTGLIAEAGAGSYGTYRGTAHASVVQGEAVRLGLDAGINHTDGYNQIPESIRGPVNVPTSFTAHNAALTGDVDFGSGLTGKFRASYFDNHQNLLSHVQHNDQRTWRYTGTLNQALGERGGLSLTLFHDNSRFTTDNAGSPEGADPSKVEFLQNRHRTPVNDWGASLVWSRKLDGVVRELSAGVDWHRISGTDFADIFDESGTRPRTDIGGGKQRFAGGFVQASVKPVPPLELLASVRYQDFYNYGGIDLTPGGLGQVPARHDTDVDPRLSARYGLSGGFALRAAAYRAFRAPTLDNLYRAFSIPGGIFYGNPTLRPETMDGVEAGMDFEKGPVRIQATAFASRIKNVITSRPLADAELPAGFFFGSRLINASRARSRGLEAEADVRLADTLRATVAYTFADSVVTSNPLDPASVGLQQAGVPRHRVSAGLDWTGPHGITLSPRLRYVSRTNGDPDGLLHTDAHFIVDLSASAKLTKGFEGFVQVENLFNRRYIADNSGFSPPLLGSPLTALAGVRVTVR